MCAQRLLHITASIMVRLTLDTPKQSVKASGGHRVGSEQERGHATEVIERSASAHNKTCFFPQWFEAKERVVTTTMWRYRETSAQKALTEPAQTRRIICCIYSRKIRSPWQASLTNLLGGHTVRHLSLERTRNSKSGLFQSDQV